MIPCGVYVTGSIRIRSNVELYLESGAILKGSRDPEDYSNFTDDKLEPVTVLDGSSRWSHGLIRAFDVRDIAVTGELTDETTRHEAGCFRKAGNTGSENPYGRGYIPAG